MARVWLIEGPVGAGKSTHALALAQAEGAHFLCLDAWMAQRRPPDASLANYADRKASTLELLLQEAERRLAAGESLVLELGLVRQAERMAFHDWAEQRGYDVEVRVLEVPEEVRRARVAHRNLERGPTWSMDVPEEIFEFADQAWEAVDDAESLFDVVRIDGTRGL